MQSPTALLLSTRRPQRRSSGAARRGVAGRVGADAGWRKLGVAGLQLRTLSPGGAGAEEQTEQFTPGRPVFIEGLRLARCLAGPPPSPPLPEPLSGYTVVREPLDPASRAGLVPSLPS